MFKELISVREADFTGRFKEEEEGTIFKTAEKVLSQNKFQSILKQFVEEKQKFKENLQ